MSPLQKHKTTESPSSRREKRQFVVKNANFTPGKTQKLRVLRVSVVKITFLQ